MKELSFFILLAGFFLCTKNVFAQEKLIVKQKKISRHYKVNATDSLIIKNGFGNVIIHTWNKNEVTIDITETAQATTEKRVREILDTLRVIEHTAKKGRIAFSTFIKLHENYGVRTMKTPNDREFEASVVYVINAPKNIALDVSNIVGDVYIDDFSGGLNIDIIHGEFHAKNISGPDKKIAIISDDVDSSTINSIQTGYLTGGGLLVINKPVDTAKVKIHGFQMIKINNEYY